MHLMLSFFENPKNNKKINYHFIVLSDLDLAP